MATHIFRKPSVRPAMPHSPSSNGSAMSTTVSLRTKVLVVLATLLMTYLGLSQITMNYVMFPAFQQLDQGSAAKNLTRVAELIADDLKTLAKINLNWSHWDETHQFLSGSNPAYVATNLEGSWMQDNELNMMLFFDPSERLVWGRLASLENREIPMAAAFPAGGPPNALMMSHAPLDSSIKGLLGTEWGPMLVSSLPILTTKHEGPVAGTCIFGRFLDRKYLAALEDRSKVNVAVYSAIEAALPEPYKATARSLKAGKATVEYVETDQVVRAFSLLRDIHGKPLLLLRVDTPRGATAVGAQTIRAALLSLLMASALVVLVVWLLLRYMILAPILALTRHVLYVGQSGDLTRHLMTARHDEVGTLEREFKQMQDRLAIAKRTILMHSYKAGIADSAAGVLHNIRNALTPLTSRLGQLISKLREPPGLRLPTAVQELGGMEIPEDRRRKLIEYAQLALEQHAHQRQQAIEEIYQTLQHLSHIEHIITDQERLSRSDPIIESTTPAAIIDEAISLLPDHAAIRPWIQIDPSVDVVGTIATRRIALVQVITNVLLNAVEAIRRARRVAGIIQVSAEHEKDGAEPMLRITIRDNGAGIEPGHQQTIFQRGYTTKADGKGGLGLHWCANTLNNMGGKISVESADAMQGAVFHILIPL